MRKVVLIVLTTPLSSKRSRIIQHPISSAVLRLGIYCDRCDPGYRRPEVDEMFTDNSGLGRIGSGSGMHRKVRFAL